MKAIAAAAMVGVAAILGGIRTAAADGASLVVTPGSGACTDTMAVHAEGLRPNAIMYLFASAGNSLGELITFDYPTTSSWDFTLPAGARYLCDDFAAPTMDLAVWAESEGSGHPDILLASATFTRTNPDAISPGPNVQVVPDHGSCRQPMLLVGSGFPPDQPVDVVLGPLYSTPGSGGAGIGVDGGTTAPDGSYRSDILSTTAEDGSLAAAITDSIGANECAHFGRLKITVVPAKARANAGDFLPAVTYFRRGGIAAPAAGSGVAHNDSPRWIVALAWVAVAAAVGMALVALRRR